MSVTRQLNLCQDARFIFKSYSSSLPYIYYKVTVLVYPKNKLYLINKAHSSLLYYLYCLWNSIKDLFSFKPPFFFSESGCKGKKFIIYLPNNFGSFFFFFSSLQLSVRKERRKQEAYNNKPYASNHPRNAALVLESGCKSRAFKHYSQTL